ncbi:hypothetical protein IFR05_015716 [Cadophora sp. M221]|nr:hypothetical protein IFR05_015716 [Cadophora sp. M221]
MPPKPGTFPKDPSLVLPPAQKQSSPLEVVYNIHTKKFRLERRFKLLPQEASVPLIEMQENMPPLLVDGRMTIVQVPRWKIMKPIFYRRTGGMVVKRDVALPAWVCLGRNGVGRWKELFIEGV